MIGAACSRISVLPWLRPGLVQALTSVTPTPRRALRQFHGKHAVTRPANDHQDALILEIRRLHEQVLLGARQIHTLLATAGYDKSYSWVRQTCIYHNRSHLVPALGAASYLPLPSSPESLS